MKKELLKGTTMLAAVIMIALATAAVSAKPQAGNKVVANIPFEFSVGYKTMPAGEYSLQTIASANDAVMIQTLDGMVSVLRLSEATSPARNKSQARLIFHRYGERYFLAEVWNGSDTVGRRLLKSQEESALARELSLASPGINAPNGDYEIVEVTAALR